MGALLIIVGLGWLGYTILKEEAFTKQAPKDTDFRQACIDSCNGVKGKELDRRIQSGYYVKKDK